MLLTVKATSGAAWCCWWLCSLVDGKLQKKFHSSQSCQENIKRARCRHQKNHIWLASQKFPTHDIEFEQVISVSGQSSWQQPNVASSTVNIAFYRSFVVSGGLASLRATCQWKIEHKVNRNCSFFWILFLKP